LRFLPKILQFKTTSKQKDLQQKLEGILPFKPQNLSLYHEALTHKAKNLKDKNGQKINFERLEFLGDAIIETVVSEFLFKEMPLATEGELTIMRSKIVNREHLNELGEILQLTKLLDLRLTPKQMGNDIAGNLYEALVGAIFLDKSYKGAKKFIYNSMIDSHIDLEKLNKKISSYKSYMIEWAQKNHKSFKFLAHNDTHNGKSNYFKVDFMLDDQKISHGRSSSKKKAEEIAARRAYYTLQPQKDV
jgi:ribonuclease-3